MEVVIIGSVDVAFALLWCFFFVITCYHNIPQSLLLKDFDFLLDEQSFARKCSRVCLA
jgi:hypothetical protein